VPHVISFGFLQSSKQFFFQDRAVARNRRKLSFAATEPSATRLLSSALIIRFLDHLKSL